MSEKAELLKRPPALPAKMEDWTRHLKHKRSILDQVEDIHRILVEHEEKGEQYRSYLDAVYDEHAVEGSLEADDFEAATMIKDYALESGQFPDIAGEKKAVLTKAFRGVLKRYHAERWRRRGEVGEEAAIE